MNIQLEPGIYIASTQYVGIDYVNNKSRLNVIFEIVDGSNSGETIVSDWCYSSPSYKEKEFGIMMIKRLYKALNQKIELPPVREKLEGQMVVVKTGEWKGQPSVVDVFTYTPGIQVKKQAQTSDFRVLTILDHNSDEEVTV